MSIRKISALVGATAMLAAGFALSTPGTAHADPALVNGAFPAPAAKDLVTVGSDTTQLLVGALGTYYNSHVVGTAADKGAGAKIVSYDACTLPAGQYYPCTAPTTGTTDNSNTTNRIRLANNSAGNPVYIDRPNGSGAGRNALGSGGAANDAPGVAFSRSSGALDDNAVAAHLEAFPFAVDTLQMVSSATTHLPASLTWTQIKGIYNGTYKTIGDIDPTSAYKTERIHAYFPQSGSGTMQFFMQQLDPAGSKNTGAWSAGGSQCEWNATTGAYYTCSSTVNVSKQVQEHDPTFIKSDPDAIAPFSVGRMTLINNQTPNTIKAIGTNNGKPYQVQRAVYNVVRTQNNAPSGETDNPAWFANSTLMKSLFAPWNSSTNTGGFFCSPAAKGTIEAQGFLQLKSGAGEPCGVGIVTTNAPSNLDTNTAGKMTSKIGGTIPATNYGAAHTLTVKVLGQSGVIPTGRVSVKVNKVTYTPKLDATGTAKVAIPTTTNAGTYTATLTYAGDVNFNGSSATTKVVINKLATTLTSTAPTTVTTGNTFTASVVVKAAKTPIGWVSMWKGSTQLVEAKLSSTGAAKLTLTAAQVKANLPINTQTKLTLKYAGNPNFKASSKYIYVTRK